MTIRAVMSRAVSHPKVNRIQTAVLGRNKLEARLAAKAARTVAGREGGTIVDVGGGTARSRRMWPATWTYLSVDPDVRLLALDDSDSDVARIVGDAADIPLSDDFANVVLMQCVSHHLDASVWPRSLREINRILKPDGYFIFLDGVWSPDRWISRVFWRLDAGQYPRSSSDLEAAVGSQFDVVDVDRFALIHDAILISARPIQ